PRRLLPQSSRHRRHRLPRLPRARPAAGGSRVNPPEPPAPGSIDRLLGDDEHALLVFRASPAMIVLASWPTVAVCVVIAGAALGLGAITSQSLLAGLVAAGAVAVAALRIGWAALVWLARRYALTDQRVLRAGGVLGRLTLEAP